MRLFFLFFGINFWNVGKEIVIENKVLNYLVRVMKL